MNSQEYIEIEDRYGAHNYHPLDVVISKGKGVWVYDLEGKKYLDCLSAYSALNQGHVHPAQNRASHRGGGQRARFRRPARECKPRSRLRL